MATGTGTSAIHLRMIHGRYRNPAGAYVTSFADVRRIDVAIRQTAVATRCRAGAIHLRVIHRRYRSPTGAYVTSFADVR